MLLNRATVCALTGLSTGSLYRRMKAGLFPPQVIYRPLKIRGWRREDIDKWLSLRWELEPEAAVAACGCWRHADLQGLIEEGWGDEPLIHLRWRCVHCGLTFGSVSRPTEARSSAPAPLPRRHKVGASSPRQF